MPEYTVEWTSTYTTDSPVTAAREAWADMQRSHSIANVFEVSDEMDLTVHVDLDDIQDSPAVWVPRIGYIADLAEWMHKEQWDFSEIVEMIRKPHKYADEYSRMIADRAFDEVAKEPEELEDPENVSDLRVSFQPQKWVDDQAIEVTVDWDQFEWNVSVETAHAVERQLSKREDDWDFIKDDEFTPKWIRDWKGPFYIEPLPDGHEYQSSEFYPDECAGCGNSEVAHLFN